MFGEDVAVNEEQAEGVEEGIQSGEDNSAEMQENGTQEGVVESEFDPEPWGYKYQGQMYYPKDQQHIKTLMSQAHMATQRVAEIKKREEEYSQLGKKYEQYGKMEDAFEKIPQFKNELMQLYSKYATGQPQEQPGNEQGQSQAQIPPELLQRVESVESFKKELEEKRADDELKGEIDTLKSKYQDSDWELDEGDGNLTQRVLKYACENNFPTLESAYRDMHWDQAQVNAKSNAIKAQQAKRMKDKQAGVVMGDNQRKESGKPVDFRSMNYNQITEQALKRIK